MSTLFEPDISLNLQLCTAMTHRLARSFLTSLLLIAPRISKSSTRSTYAFWKNKLHHDSFLPISDRQKERCCVAWLGVAASPHLRLFRPTHVKLNIAGSRQSPSIDLWWCGKSKHAKMQLFRLTMKDDLSKLIMTWFSCLISNQLCGHKWAKLFQILGNSSVSKRANPSIYPTVSHPIYFKSQGSFCTPLH